MHDYHDDNVGRRKSKRKRIRKRKPRKQQHAANIGEGDKDNLYDSMLRVFFANVTYLGNKTITYLINRPEHIVGVVETHLLGDEAHKAMNEFSNVGWVRSMSPATNAEDK